MRLHMDRAMRVLLGICTSMIILGVRHPFFIPGRIQLQPSNDRFDLDLFDDRDSMRAGIQSAQRTCWRIPTCLDL